MMRVEVVQLVNFRAPNFYARVTYDDGRTFHSEPWLSVWAAEKCAEYFRARLAVGRRLHPW